MENIKTLKNLIPATSQRFLLPFAFLISLVILFVIAVSIGYSSISSQLTQIEQARKDVNILTQKELFLREVDRRILEKSDSLVDAIPYSNAALFLLSGLKSLANQKSVIISNLKVGAEEKNPDLALSFVDVSFDIDGEITAIFDFMKATGGIAPLSSLQKTTLSGQGTFLKAEVVLRTFFSPLPEKLPALTDQVEEFSDKEVEVIAKLGVLSSSVLDGVVAVPNASITPREDPFIY